MRAVKTAPVLARELQARLALQANRKDSPGVDASHCIRIRKFHINLKAKYPRA